MSSFGGLSEPGAMGLCRPSRSPRFPERGHSAAKLADRDGIPPRDGRPQRPAENGAELLDLLAREVGNDAVRPGLMDWSRFRPYAMQNGGMSVVKPGVAGDKGGAPDARELVDGGKPADRHVVRDFAMPAQHRGVDNRYMVVDLAIVPRVTLHHE